MFVGSYQNSNLTVTFSDTGKTITMSPGVTVWVPHELHERVRFELQLPSNVRQDLSQEEDYPQESLPGYPTSGPVANPKEYETFETRIMGPTMYAPQYHFPQYVPAYPVVYKHTTSRPRSVVMSAMDQEKTIPGTEMTEEQLNEKVMAQIMDNKMFLEGQRREQEISKIKEEVKERVNEKLLSKREDQEINSLIRKSVTFEEGREEERSDFRDSGMGSMADLEMSDLDLEDYEITDGEEEEGTRDIGVGTDSSLLFRTRRFRKRRKGDRRLPWRYWKNEEVPSLLESNNYGPYRYGPFRDCMIAAPLESRTISKNEKGGETLLSM